MRVHRLAVDVQLQLVGGAVADAHRPRAAPALEVVEGFLAQVARAVDPVHDLQRAGAGPGPGLLARPGPAARRRTVGLLGEAKAEQRVDRERAVADPGVPVVPVPLAAHLLGQPGGGGGDERAARRVLHELERHGGPGDRLPPPAPVRRLVQPATPERDGVMQQPVDVLVVVRSWLAPAGLQDDAPGLPGLQRPGGGDAVAYPFQLHRVAVVGRPPGAW